MARLDPYRHPLRTARLERRAPTRSESRPARRIGCEMRTSTRSSRHPNGSTERAHRDSGDAPRCARVALPVFWMSMTQLEPPPSLNSPFRSTHTRAAKQCESPETTPRNERACKFGTSYDSRRQICPRTRHGLFVKKMSLASLAIGGFTMGAADGGVAKMDVSLDDIIKQVRTTPCIDTPENYNCCLKRALWF